MRPTTFEEVIGNTHITEPLARQLADNTLNHSLLISGETGTGKTTIAHIIASELKADVTEVDCGSEGGVDVIRGVIEETTHTSLFAKNKVFILDEAHKLSQASQSALLRTLEEAQEGVYFILLTNEPQKLLKTVRTRCLHYKTSTPGNEEIGIAVNRVLGKYGIQVENRADFWGIIEQAEGSLRQVYSLLEKLIAVTDDDGFVSSASFKRAIGAVDEDESDESLARLFAKGHRKDVLEAVKGLQRKAEINPYSQAFGIYNYMKAVYLGGGNVEPGLMVDLAEALDDKNITWITFERLAWKYLR